MTSSSTTYLLPLGWSGSSNMMSTIAMVRLGKVIGNLMVDLNPSNIKLRDRAVRILQELTDCSAEAAHAALEKSGWVVKDAWVSLKKRKR